jgi:hypothetical protein
VQTLKCAIPTTDFIVSRLRRKRIVASNRFCGDRQWQVQLFAVMFAKIRCHETNDAPIRRVAATLDGRLACRHDPVEDGSLVVVLRAEPLPGANPRSTQCPRG